MLRTTIHPEQEKPVTDAKGMTGLWPRLLILLLMTLVLVAAAGLSAITAMRFAIRGQEVVVPALGGMLQADAARLLMDSELGLEIAGRRFSGTSSEGHILDQTPEAGTRVKRGRNVRVLLSLGERTFPVPELMGSSFRSAQILLDQRGLSVGNTIYTHTPAGEPNTVVFQRPTPGDIGGDDPNVSVLVSLGPLEQYYVMPDLRGQPADLVIGRIRSEGFRLGPVTYTMQAGTQSGLVIQQQPPAGYKVSENDIVLLEVSQ